MHPSALHKPGPWIVDDLAADKSIVSWSRAMIPFTFITEIKLGL